MNRVFNIVWHHTLQAWVVVSEFGRRGKKSKRRVTRVLSRFAIASLLMSALGAHAQLPTGGAPVNGSATINDPNGGMLTVNQHGDRAIVNWDSFSIGAGNQVHFQQEAGQAILNRVLGNEASNIAGQLTGGGAVWLINPNGVLIGSGARIETQSFIASTLDISNDQFLNNESTLTFKGDSSSSIVNQGSITALGGDIVLIARRVQNSGDMQAPEGVVGLVAGNDVELTLQDARSSWLSPIKVKPALGESFGGDGVSHEGVIAAARAELAAAGGNIYGMAVNVSGDITTQSTSDYESTINLASEGGSIAVSPDSRLRAAAGAISIDTAPRTGGETGGEISIAGRLDASAEGNAEGWSTIFILGDRVQIKSTAVLDASGEGVGGFIDIRSTDSQPMNELNIDHGAVLLANGEEGLISLEAKDMSIAAELEAQGPGSSIRIANADIVNAAAARIETRFLNLENVLAADIGNADNAFEELMFVMWHEGMPGDMTVNSGGGSLDVYGEGSVRYKNLMLISEDDLRLGEYAASIGVSEQAVLASLQGKLHIDLPDDGALADAQRIRLYSREDSELNGLDPDNIVADVVFPDDPDGESPVVLYRIVDAPDPTPEPEPGTGESPDDWGEDDPRQAAMESLGRDSAHQQQIYQGMRFVVTVDPLTGLPALFVRVGLGEGRVNVTDDLSRPALLSTPIYSGQDGPDDAPTSGSGIDPDVLQALLNAMQETEAENAEFLEALRNAMGGDDHGGSGLDFNDEEQLSAYRNTLNSLINNIAQQAAQRGALTSEQLEQSLNETNQQVDRGYDLNRDVPAIDRTAGVDDAAEQRRQQMRDEAEQRRQQQQQQAQDRRDQVAQQNSDLLDRLEQARQQQEEQNRQALEEQRQQAAERLASQLSEEQRQQLGERINQREQERETQGEQAQQSRPQQGDEGSGTSTLVAEALGGEVSPRVSQGQEGSEGGAKSKQDVRDALRQRSPEGQTQQEAFGSPGNGEDVAGSAGSGLESGGGGTSVAGEAATYVEALATLADSGNADAQRLVQILEGKTAAEAEEIVEQFLPRDTAPVSDVSSQAAAATKQSVRAQLRNRSQKMATQREQEGETQGGQAQQSRLQQGGEDSGASTPVAGASGGETSPQVSQGQEGQAQQRASGRQGSGEDVAGSAGSGLESGGGGTPVAGEAATYVEALAALADSGNADAQRLVQILEGKTAAEAEEIVEQFLPRDKAPVSDVSSQAAAATKQSARAQLRNRSQKMATTRPQTTGPVPVNMGGL